MAIKTFSSGEVLTASDTNTYLANAGLVYVTSATLSGSLVQISNVFSSTYDSYRVVLSGASCDSGARFVGLYFGPSTVSGYNTTFYSGRVDLTGTTFSGATDANTAYWNTSIVVNATPTAGGVIDLHNPYTAVQASFSAQGTDARYDGSAAFWRSAGGSHNQTGSYTQLNLTCVGASFDAGTVTVYGYRKA